QISRVLDAFRRAEQLVVGRRELLLDLAGEHLVREQRAAFDVDAAVDDFAHGVPGRRKRLADVQQVAPELRDPPARLIVRPRVYALLELLDLLVYRVEQVDVALGDVVDDEVGDHPRRLLVRDRVAGIADVRRVEGRPFAGRLAHGDDAV